MKKIIVSIAFFCLIQMVQGQVEPVQEQVQDKVEEKVKEKVQDKSEEVEVKTEEVEGQGEPIPNPDEQIIDKVIIKVGGEYVLYSEVINNYRYIKNNNPKANINICAVAEQVISQKILVDQAKLDSVEVSDIEVEGQLDFRFQNIMRQLGGDEAKFLEYYGKSIPELKEEQRDDMKQQILAERIQGQLINEVTITPKEVIEFFEMIPKDSIPFLSSEVEISEIVIKPKVNAVEHEKSSSKLLEIRESIMSGEMTFEEAAMKFSADGSAQDGGNLGWAKRGSYVPEFEAAAYSLEKDEISEIVESEFGFHIIKMNERRGNSIKVQHVLIRPEITENDLVIAQEKLDSVKQLIEVDSLPFDYAVRIYSDKKSENYHNGGRMANPKTGDNYFDTGDLAPDVYFQTEEMEVGEISPPLEYTNRGGETLYRVIKLDSRTKPHRASLEQDYSKISSFAKESKKNLYYNKWMIEKMNETFIKVDPDLSSCTNLAKWIDEEEAQSIEKPTGTGSKE